MSQLDSELKRVIGWARQAPTGPDAPISPGLSTRVIAGSRQRDRDEISARFLGGIIVTSAALASVWAFVFLGPDPIGPDQTFNEIATRMVTSVGR